MSRKVALYASHLPVGGVPRMLVNITAGLADMGLDVDLVLQRKEGPFLEFVSPKVRVVDLGGPAFWAVPFALWRYLRREKPAALMATGLHRNVYAMVAGLLNGHQNRLVLSERIVVSQYGSDFHAAWQQWLLRIGYGMLGRILFPKADAIHAVSEEAARDLEQFCGLPHGRVEVVYNPFINPQLRLQKEAPVEHPWFADGQPPVVLSVGRLHPQKNYVTLIRAFARVAERSPARLLIIAEGSERPMLEALVTELGLNERVSLHGFDANPFAYMARCDVFVLSSAYEGCPNVLIEALGCGAPVVSTRCPGGPAEVLEDGAYGPLVPVGDAEAMAEAILAQLADGGARARTQAFLDHKGWRFSFEESVKSYYRLLVGNEPPHSVHESARAA